MNSGRQRGRQMWRGGQKGWNMDTKRETDVEGLNM